MIFTSFKFLCFLLVVLVVYYAIPLKYRWCWLLIGSYWFYMASNPKYIIYLLATTVISYFCALQMGKISVAKDNVLSQKTAQYSKKEIKEYKIRIDKKRKHWCAIAIIFCIALLGVLKYSNFFAENIYKLFGKGSFETRFQFILPLGLSFYIFQTIGYCIDVYRGVIEPEQNIFKYALFLSYFPQILQGPIARFERVFPNLIEGHKFSYKNLTYGLQRILWGFFKKLVIADRAALLVDNVFTNYFNYSGVYVFFAVIIYAIQIYADFSGFMDIALGTSEALGITLDENFDRPYFSTNIPEFWRRWHISLGSWFKDYLFYPVLRSKMCQKISKSKHLSKSLRRTLPSCVSLIIVWATTGLWHGASWNYVAWGSYYGILIILSIVFSPYISKTTEKLKINMECLSGKIFRMTRTFLLVCFGYIFFRAPGLKIALDMIRHIVTNFGFKTISLSQFFNLGLTIWEMRVLLFATVLLFMVSLLQEKYKIRESISKQWIVVRWIIYWAGIFSTILLGIYGEISSSSFIYFKF